MKLDSLKLTNFRCFGDATTIDFADGLTVLVGANGTGKTAVLMALARMFGRNGRGRGLSALDFSITAAGESPDEDPTLELEATFSFPELATDTSGALPAVADHIKELVSVGPSGQLVRLRLTGTLYAGGRVEEEMVAITSPPGEPTEETKPVRGVARNCIHVEYIPATRDPSQELAHTSNAILGRLVRALDISKEARGDVESAANAVADALSAIEGVKTLEKRVNDGWSRLHRATHHKTAMIQATPRNITELLKQISMRFIPGEAQPESGVEHLSDGQRSLFYLSLVHAALQLERTLMEADPADSGSGFDRSRVQSPSFTLLAMEEPETHLAPHYLGRILHMLKDLSDDGTAQVVLTTHAPGIAQRTDPRHLLHLRLGEHRSIVVGNFIGLDAETYQCVKGTLWASPELLFARVVVLVEGDSERLVVPAFFRAHAKAPLGTGVVNIQDIVDESFISVVAIEGRYTKQHWKLQP